MPAAADANNRPMLSLRSSPNRFAQAGTRRRRPSRAMRRRAGKEPASAIDAPSPRRPRLFDPAHDLDVEFAQLLAQRVAVEPEQLGRPDLVAARRRQGKLQERPLDLAQDPVVE